MCNEALMCTTKSNSSPAHVLGFLLHRTSMGSIPEYSLAGVALLLFGERSGRCRWCASGPQVEFAFIRDQAKGPSQVFVLRKSGSTRR